MAIDRKGWTQMRDKAKVPSGFASLDMGPNLDKHFKVMINTSGKSWKDKYSSALTIEKRCLTYLNALKKSKDPNIKKFATKFDTDIYQQLGKEADFCKQMSEPGVKMKRYFGLMLADYAKVKDGTTFNNFWSQYLRGIGTCVTLCKQALPGPDYQKLATAWPPRMSSQAFVAEALVDDAGRAKCLKEVKQQAAALHQVAHSMGWW